MRAFLRFDKTIGRRSFLEFGTVDRKVAGSSLICIKYSVLMTVECCVATVVSSGRPSALPNCLALVNDPPAEKQIKTLMAGEYRR